MRNYMYNILRYPYQVADGEMITGKLHWYGQSSSKWSEELLGTHSFEKKTSPKTIDLPAFDFYDQSKAGNSNASRSNNFTCT